MPVEALQIGPTYNILAGVTYAIPGVRVKINSPVSLPYNSSNNIGGTFTAIPTGTTIRLGWIKPAANTTVRLDRVKWGGAWSGTVP